MDTVYGNKSVKKALSAVLFWRKSVSHDIFFKT
jgi:hypothetical protein